MVNIPKSPCPPRIKTESDGSDSWIVSEKETEQRLDKSLTAHFDYHYSRSYFQFLIENGLVLVNGQVVKKRTKLTPGDEVEVEFAATAETDLLPEAIPLDILYEDEHCLLINKPAGLVVHPAPGNWTGTFVNGLLYHCQTLSSELCPNTLRPGIVHRLDKDTSGILLAAKHLEAQQKFIALFSSRTIHKEYLAVCVGLPYEGTIALPIGRHPILRKQMAVVQTGREAITESQNLGWDGKLGVAKLILKTGRTHQIRVHLQSKGTPVLGDALYGSASANRRYGVLRQLLHASLIRFTHPFSGENIEIRAPLPEDISLYIKKILNQNLDLHFFL